MSESACVGVYVLWFALLSLYAFAWYVMLVRLVRYIGGRCANRVSCMRVCGSQSPFLIWCFVIGGLTRLVWHIRLDARGALHMA